jgi:LysM repeat protein
MTIVEKLSAIQQEIKAPKNLKNSFGGYMYRNAESILEAFKPYEGKYKVALALSDDVVQVGERYYIKATATLYDTESHETMVASSLAKEAHDKKGMDDSQITGTASSYARKYALNGLLLLDDTKDADTDEYQKQSRPEKATSAQIKTIEGICAKHKVDIDALYAMNNIDKKNITAAQAGQLLASLKKKFGDE